MIHFFINKTCTTQDDAFIEFKRQQKKLFSHNPLTKQSQFIAFTSLLMTNGRGRTGRRWIAKDIGNINTSIAFSLPDLFSSSTIPNTMIPIIISVLVAQSMNLYNIKNFTHKWPNDFLIDNKKVGGIIIERKEDFYIVGIGINLYHAPDVPDVITTNITKYGIDIIDPNLKNLSAEKAIESITRNMINNFTNNLEEIFNLHKYKNKNHNWILDDKFNFYPEEKLSDEYIRKLNSYSDKSYLPNLDPENILNVTSDGFFYEMPEDKINTQQINIDSPDKSRITQINYTKERSLDILNQWRSFCWKKSGDIINVKFPDGTKTEYIFKEISNDGRIKVHKINKDTLSKYRNEEDAEYLSYGDVS